MSFIRAGHPLVYFEGESKLYVYPSDNGVVDYNADYKDNASLAELLVRFISMATDDKKYALKMAGILAKKLKVRTREAEKVS